MVKISFINKLNKNNEKVLILFFVSVILVLTKGNQTLASEKTLINQRFQGVNFSIKDEFYSKYLESYFQDFKYSNLTFYLHSNKQNKLKVIKEQHIEMRKLNEEKKKLEEIKAKEVDQDDFTLYQKVPLKEETQRFIWEQSKKYGISYELVLAVIKVESNFDKNAVSYNGTSYGLMQINKNNTLHWLAGEVGLSNPDPFNLRHSVMMGTWYLSYLKNKWIERGLSEENARKAALISYHKGETGGRRYIKNNGFNSQYTNKVLDYKHQLEVIK